MEVGVTVADLPDTTRLPEPPHRLLRRAKGPGMALFAKVWRLQLHHRELVPATGPVILASNHIAVLDGPLLVGASPRHTYALAKQELFRGVVGRLLRMVGQIPVARGVADPGAVRRCVQVLARGDALGIFPEGERGAGDFSRIRPGVAYLAMLTGAPVVPVAMIGTRRSGGTPKQLPRRGSEVHVVFGAPLPVEPVPWPRHPAAVAQVSEELRRALLVHHEYALSLV